MEVYFNGPGGNRKYYDNFYHELVECFKQDGDDILLDAQNDAWSGLISYYKSNGAEVDF